MCNCVVNLVLNFSIRPQLEKRFNKAFNTESVALISKRNVHFVSINSMAMENDGCFLCYNAEIKLRQISSKIFFKLLISILNRICFRTTEM